QPSPFFCLFEIDARIGEIVRRIVLSNLFDQSYIHCTPVAFESLGRLPGLEIGIPELELIDISLRIFLYSFLKELNGLRIFLHRRKRAAVDGDRVAIIGSEFDPALQNGQSLFLPSQEQERSGEHRVREWNVWRFFGLAAEIIERSIHISAHELDACNRRPYAWQLRIAPGSVFYLVEACIEIPLLDQRVSVCELPCGVSVR